MLKKINSKIIEIKNLTKDTKKFILSVPKDFNFKAGQYILLELKIQNKIQRRAYSIASSPKERGKMELCIKKVAKKGFASELFELKINSNISFLGPVGKFYINSKPKKQIVFISTGTGIAPFKSMIEYLLKNLKFKKQIILIQGYRNKKDIPYNDFFSGLEKQFPNFRQHVILSKNDKGYVQDFIQKLTPDPEKSQFYICGLKEMISETIQKLKLLKIKQENIFFEKYN